MAEPAHHLVHLMTTSGRDKPTHRKPLRSDVRDCVLYLTIVESKKMHRLLQAALLLLTTATLTAYSSAATLTVTIENTETADGLMMLQILQGETEFKGDREAITSIQQRALESSMSFSVSHLPAGEYAIQVMHDRNGNGKLDTNFVGIPNEPWAFSNNSTGNMGPPKWADVKFVLSDDVTQSIRLNH